MIIVSSKIMLADTGGIVATEIIELKETALAPTTNTRAEHYERASHAKRTWDQYRSAWQQFETWCSRRGSDSMPATTETIKAYLASLADQGRAVSTVNAYLAAVASAHSIAGHPIDRAALKDTLKGIRREKARPQRQARPLIAGDIRALLGDFAPGAPSDDRDAALLTLGFAAALRRVELVGLDWQEQGDGDGFVTKDDRGLVVTLLRTKGGKGEPETVIVPCQDMPAACEALERWARAVSLRPGEPVFRPVDKGQRIGSGRLTGRSVARIIKARVRARAVANGMSEPEAEAIAEVCSGHSLRAG
jgi:site-specific recombinase XerD